MEDMKLWRCPEMNRRVHADDRATRIILEAVLVALWDEINERILEDACMCLCFEEQRSRQPTLDNQQGDLRLRKCTRCRNAVFGCADCTIQEVEPLFFSANLCPPVNK